MEISHEGKSVILLYHQIGISPIKQTNLDCYCKQDLFEEQMAYLYDSHHKVIALDELVLKINSQKSIFKDSYVVLTFDDGCDKFSEMALPILKKYNFPSTMYPVAGCLGKVASWPKIFNPDLNIVSEVELRHLSNQGVNIGAHTMNHVKLTKCDFIKAKEEIEQSKQALEDITGKEITSFSYPHGDYNEDICSLIKTLGFFNAVTCKSNFVNSDSDLFQLPRKYVTYFDNLDTFKNILNYD